MKAAFINATGGPESIVVADFPDPTPGPGQVRVKVRAAAVNPIDLYIRSGAIPMPMGFPYIVGADLAGTVESLGPGTTGFQVGDRVWASNQGLMGRQGCTAELAVVDAEWLHHTPKNMKDPDAAAWALVGITAHLGLFERAALKAGESVYISGGSGGIGTIAIQMAKAAGARVACTAGTAEKTELCRSLGADVVINYKHDDLVARLREFSEEGVDVWLETQREPDLDTIVSLLRKRGRLVLMAGRTARPVFPVGPFYTRNASILGFAMFNASAAEQAKCAADMNQWAAAGRLKAIIGRTFPLSETAEAHRFLEASTIGGAGHVIGKVVIKID